MARKTDSHGSEQDGSDIPLSSNSSGGVGTRKMNNNFYASGISCSAESNSLSFDPYDSEKKNKPPRSMGGVGFFALLSQFWYETTVSSRIVKWLTFTILGSWLLWRVFQFIDINSIQHPTYQKCKDLTIVAELSTYNSTGSEYGDMKAIVTEIAIQSWLLNTHNVIVLVEDEMMCNGINKKFRSLKCIQHHCNHQDHHIPTVPCLMMIGEAHAVTKYILFTNGDITFSPLYPTLSYIVKSMAPESEEDLLDGVSSVGSTGGNVAVGSGDAGIRQYQQRMRRDAGNFVLTGQRIDIHSSKVLKRLSSFNDVDHMLSLARVEGELHGESAIDYFIYPKSLSFASKMPPFLLGNWKWDNWLLHDLISSKRTTVIDSTIDIHAIHVGSTAVALGHRPGAVYNSRVFESSTFGLQGVGMGTFKYADAKMEGGKVVYNTDFEIAQTKFIFAAAKSSETLIIVTVPCGFLGMLQNWLTWAKRSSLDNFVIFAMDKQVYTYARENKLPYVRLSNPKLLFGNQYNVNSKNINNPYLMSNECHIPNPGHLSTSTASDNTAGETFINNHHILQEEYLLMERNHFLRNVSAVGLGFVSISVNSIVLEPFRFTAIRNKELFGQRLTANNSLSEISDGFWGVSPAFSKSAVRLLKSVVSCQENYFGRVTGLSVKPSKESKEITVGKMISDGAIVSHAFTDKKNKDGQGESTSGITPLAKLHEKNLYFEYLQYRETPNPATSELKSSTCRYSAATKCLNQEIRKAFSGGLSILSESMVAGSVSTFMHHNPQRKGVYPSIIHQDIECRYVESTQLLNDWNLWTEKENFLSMMPYNEPLQKTEEKLASAMVVAQKKLEEQQAFTSVATGASSGSVNIAETTQSSSETEDEGPQVSLLVRILTMNRPDQLNNLLQSLKSGQYGNDTFDIEIHIDYPMKPSPQSLGLYGEVQDIAHQFKWTNGEKRIVDPGKHRGLFNMWVQPFVPRVPGQVLMVLEDDNELSPVFYSWSKTLLQHLALYKDPKLYGLSLQRQHSVIGLAPDQKYGTNFIDLKMDQSKPLYRYQLLSSWGTILFPTQWNNFVDWAINIKTKIPDFHPCIPFFFNNIWYIQKPGHIWTIWFNYYIYMQGMSSLYINYARYDEDGRYFSLLKNHRAQGLHFDGKGGAIGAKKVVARKPDMQDKLEFLMEPPPKMLLPPTSYPLYDFHLQFVSNPKVLDDRWRLMSGISERCTTNHPEKKTPAAVATKSSNSTLLTKGLPN